MVVCVYQLILNITLRVFIKLIPPSLKIHCLESVLMDICKMCNFLIKLYDMTWICFKRLKTLWEATSRSHQACSWGSEFRSGARNPAGRSKLWEDLTRNKSTRGRRGETVDRRVWAKSAGPAPPEPFKGRLAHWLWGWEWWQRERERERVLLLPPGLPRRLSVYESTALCLKSRITCRDLENGIFHHTPYRFNIVITVLRVQPQDIRSVIVSSSHGLRYQLFSSASLICPFSIKPSSCISPFLNMSLWTPWVGGHLAPAAAPQSQSPPAEL